jgi:hypothetical protein
VRPETPILKKHFGVLTIPNTEALITPLDPEQVIRFGIANDVCDSAAIEGPLRPGRPRF